MSLPKSSRRKYLAFVMTGVLTITSLVCLLINFLALSSGPWSFFVCFSCALFWLFFILPLVVYRRTAYIYILVDAAAISLYLFSYTITLNSHGWFMEIVLPSLALITVISVVMTYWLNRNKREWPDVCIFITVSLGVTCVMVDLLLHAALSGSPAVSFSIVGAACAAALIVFFAFISRNRRFREWITRKTHV